MGHKKRASNSRQHKRINADFLLKYEQDEGKVEPRITNIKNVSAGGVKFLTREMLPENSSIYVNVLIPPLEKSFPARARILRVRRLRKRFIYSVAVRFTDINQNDQQSLNDFVETLAQDTETRFVVDHANVVVRRN